MSLKSSQVWKLLISRISLGGGVVAGDDPTQAPPTRPCIGHSHTVRWGGMQDPAQHVALKGVEAEVRLLH